MNKNSLPTIISHKIIEYISNNSLKAYDKLPNEYEFMKLFNVGRNTIREAIKILSSRNIVFLKQGSGTYISPKEGISEDPLGLSLIKDKEKLILDILDLRLMIEPKIASIAAINRNDKDLNELSEILNSLEKKIKSRESFLYYDQLFHAKIAQMTGNIIVSKIIPILNESIKIFSIESNEEYEQTLLSHRAIYDAIFSKNALEAESLMTYHILFNKYRDK